MNSPCGRQRAVIRHGNVIPGICEEHGIRGESIVTGIKINVYLISAIKENRISILSTRGGPFRYNPAGGSIEDRRLHPKCNRQRAGIIEIARVWNAHVIIHPIKIEGTPDLSSSPGGAV